MAQLAFDRLRQTRIADPQQDAFVKLLVAADYLRRALEEVSNRFGITHPQHNVLRILRGVHPKGHPRGEISARLMEPAPDVTRLLDRLAEKGLVERVRSPEDRRLSVARITDRGLDLLREMDEPVKAIRMNAFAALSEDEVRSLSALLDQLVL